jgi:hypothetical protein
MRCDYIPRRRVSFTPIAIASLSVILFPTAGALAFPEDVHNSGFCGSTTVKYDLDNSWNGIAAATLTSSWERSRLPLRPATPGPSVRQVRRRLGLYCDRGRHAHLSVADELDALGGEPVG